MLAYGRNGDGIDTDGNLDEHEVYYFIGLAGTFFDDAVITMCIAHL